jgi:hypothetical protein
MQHLAKCGHLPGQVRRGREHVARAFQRAAAKDGPPRGMVHAGALDVVAAARAKDVAREAQLPDDPARLRHDDPARLLRDDPARLLRDDPARLLRDARAHPARSARRRPAARAPHDRRPARRTPPPAPPAVAQHPRHPPSPPLPPLRAACPLAPAPATATKEMP